MRMNFDMKTGLAIVVFIALALAAFSFIPPPASLTQPAPVVSNAPVILGAFTGTLPCADCAGLTETLTLTQDNAGSAKGTYTLKSEYAGKGTFTTQGNWTTLRGDATDQNAVVYQLDPDTDHTMYYLKVDENSIRQLAPDLTGIDSPFDQTLHRSSVNNPQP